MQTKISYTSVSQPLAELGQAANRLSSMISDVQSVCNNISYCTGIGSGTKAELKKAITDIKEHCSCIIQLYNAGDQAMLEYYICENRLAGNNVSAVCSELSAVADATQFTNDFDWGTIRKMVGKFGFAGSVASSMWGLADGGSSVWKNAVKLVETGAGTAQKMADGKLVDLFGTFGKKASTLSDELNKYVYDPSKCSTVAAKNASKIGVAAKWVGVAFSGMLNFVDNFEEYDADYTDSGVYVETITETALDVGAGIATGVAASAIFTAVGVTFPPAWAVGIVAVGVTSVGSMITEGIEARWGIDVKEEISDFVVDATKAAGKVVKDAGKLVGKAVSTTADRISAGWKKFKSWF